MSKRIFITLVIFLQIALLSLSTAYAQKGAPKLTQADIPDAVIQALDYEYPGVKVTAWTVENDQFVAAFKEDGLKTLAYFSNQGEWVKTRATISKKELPHTITDYIIENYTDYIIANAYLQQKPGARTHYYIEARPDGVGQKMSYLTFTDEGKLMERIDPEGFDPVAKTVADDAKSAVKNNTTLPGAKPVLKEDGKTSKKDLIKEQAENKNNQQAETSKENKEKDANKNVKKKKEVEEETLAENSIPAAVKKTLTKKAQRPEDLKWYKKDSCFVAKCTVKQEPNEIIITPSGVWQKTYISLVEEKITGNMLKHLKGFYKGYKFAEAKKEMRADKQDRIYVSIYENKENYKKKIKTMIIFDKTGKLIKTIDADDFEAWVDKVEEDKSLDRYYSKMDKADGTGEIKPRELPQDLQSYISMNYPSYSYKSCTKVKDADFGEIFRIHMQSTGVSSSSEILYFNNDGKYLKKETLPDENETAGSGEFEKVDVPAAVMTAFKTKYSRVIAPEWNINEDNNYEVNFNGAKGKTICVYDKAGTLLETHSALNPQNLTQNIQTYLKQNAKGAKVMEYYSVKKSDKKMYYKVVVQNKKTKELETYWFTNAGKIVE